MRVGERGLRAETERELRDDAFVGLEETDVVGHHADGVADDATDRGGVAGDDGGPRLLRERFEVRLHRRDLRHRRDDRPLDVFGDRMRLPERQLPGQLQVKRDLGPAVDRQDADVVHLAHERNPERGGERALAEIGGRLQRLDVDDDVRLG